MPTFKIFLKTEPGPFVKKFDKWYGDKTKEWKGFYNFDQVNFRITKDDNILIERLKKGDIDFAELRIVDVYLKAKGEPFGKTVFAKKIASDKPKSYGYIAFNFKVKCNRKISCGGH